MVEAVRALDAQRTAMRDKLRTARRIYLRFGGERAWDEAVLRFRREAAEWNAILLAHNLKAPADAFHRLRIDSDAEIARIVQTDRE